MKVMLTHDGCKIWLTKLDTRLWAERSGNQWPCSTLSNRRVYAEYDRRGDLVDIKVTPKIQVDSIELHACMSDMKPRILHI